MKQSDIPIRWLRPCPALLLCAVLAAGGCASSPEAESRLRMARYYPDVENRNPWRWDRDATAPEVPPAADRDAAAANNGAQSVASAGEGEEGADGLPEDELESLRAGSGRDVASLKPLAAGDRIMVYLAGIPQAQELRDIIDGNGNLNLPLIGEVQIAGRTAAEAEQLIESRYVDGGYYRKITVSVVPQEGEFFVRGEVKREGKYVMSGTVTLLQAITEAGGYTDYANSRRVKVKRGEEVFEYDVRKIEDLEAEDPVIESGDIIIVPRRFY